MPKGNVHTIHGNYEKEVPKSTICNSSKWKYPKCLSTVEWVNEALYIHIMEQYTPMVIRKLNHIQQHGLNLPNIILCKNSDTNRIHSLWFQLEKLDKGKLF